jgi:hypothetical protein
LFEQRHKSPQRSLQIKLIGLGFARVTGSDAAILTLYPILSRFPHRARHLSTAPHSTTKLFLALSRLGRPKKSTRSIQPTKNYFTSLCAVCLRHVLQNFFVSRRSECFFLFFVVV